MADQKISDLTPTTPADADNLPIERGAAANFKVSFNALRTWLDGFFAPASHPSDTSNPHSVTAAQAGADPTGTAAAAVATHEAAGDPHSQYLTQAEADPLYDASGTAAGLVSAHEAAPDPHSQYLTQAEGDGAYEPIGETDAHRGTTNEHPTFTSSQPGFATAPGAGTNTRYMAPDGSWPEIPAGGTSTFTGLTDTPSSYAGESGKFAAVNGGENGLEFVDPPTGSGDVTITGNTVDDDVMLGAAASKGIKNSGVQISSVQLAIAGGTNGNLVSRDAAGKVQDAGVSPSDFDAAGTAAAAVAAHEAAGDPHSQYLTQAEGDGLYDASGTAAGLVSAHEAAGDPHPQYQTEAESDARYGQLAAINAWTENQTFNGVGLVSAQAGRFSLTYAPDGIYDPLDGGFEAAEGVSILLGSVTEVASLKHATGESQQVYVTENGELFGVDPPEPAWSISATDSTDTTAGAGGGQSAWVEMGFTPALVLPQDVTPGDEIQVDTRIYWVNLAGNASGTVSIGFGIDGADPVAPGATEQLGNGFAGPIPTSWTVTGLTLTAGQTLSLFMRRESGSSGQFNPVAQGTTQAHNVTIRDRREGGTGGDGDVIGPGSATNDNFAAFDGVSGKLIKDAGVSASDFAAANSPYALEIPHTWTIATGTVDNALDVLEWVVPAPAGQTTTIKRLSYKIKTGSVNLTLQQNGAPVAGYTGLAVGATRSTTAGDVALSDLDELDIVIDSGSGTGLTVTVVIEYAGTL